MTLVDENVGDYQSHRWIVYILKCADGSLYTGVTTDVVRRLKEHNSDNKKGARYTRTRRPVELVYKEKQFDRQSACKREYAIKQLTKRQKECLINTISISK